MKAVILYELNDVSREMIMGIFPRHKSLIDEFAEKGTLLAVGNFANMSEGAMGVFVNKDSAEEFVKRDPFVLEGVVAKVTLREWNEILMG